MKGCVYHLKYIDNIETVQITDEKTSENQAVYCIDTHETASSNSSNFFLLLLETGNSCPLILISN